jgi:hypothetical protein
LNASLGVKLGQDHKVTIITDCQILIAKSYDENNEKKTIYLSLLSLNTLFLGTLPVDMF